MYTIRISPFTLNGVLYSVFNGPSSFDLTIISGTISQIATSRTQAKLTYIIGQNNTSINIAQFFNLTVVEYLLVYFNFT